jgi:hypothetical protein
MQEGNRSKGGSEAFSPGQPLPPIPLKREQQAQQEAGASEQQQAEGEEEKRDTGSQEQQQEGTSGSPRAEDFEFAAMLKDMQVIRGVVWWYRGLSFWSRWHLRCHV